MHPSIGLECSQTDIGDPCCIVYDHEHPRVILHIARIESEYVVVWPRSDLRKRPLCFGHRHGS